MFARVSKQRRRNRGPSMGFGRMKEVGKPKEETATVPVAESISPEDPFDLDSYIQQPLEDSTLVKEFIQLRKIIESHALSFYHSNPIEILPASDLGRVISEELDAPQFLPGLSKSLAISITEPASRITTIRILIARSVFEGINFGGSYKRTLLSPEAVKMIAQYRVEKNPEDMDEADQIALSRWRVLGSFLFRSTHPPTNSSVSDDISKSIQESLESVLVPFVDQQWVAPKAANKQAESLTMIIRRAAKFGRLLFAQPTTWEFDWKDSSSPVHQSLSENPVKNGPTKEAPIPGAVLFPAMVKTGGLDGRRLANPITKEKAVVDMSFTGRMGSNPQCSDKNQTQLLEKEGNKAGHTSSGLEGTGDVGLHLAHSLTTLEGEEGGKGRNTEISSVAPVNADGTATAEDLAASKTHKISNEKPQVTATAKPIGTPATPENVDIRARPRAEADILKKRVLKLAQQGKLSVKDVSSRGEDTRESDTGTKKAH